MLFRSELGPDSDTVVILTFVGDYYLSFGIEYVEMEGARINHLVREMHTEFPHPGGEDDASPFKKVATFMCHFSARAPIGTPLPQDVLGTLPRGQTTVARSNATVALAIALTSLRFADVQWQDGGPARRLKNAMELSLHSFTDIADALTTVKPADAFKLASVLFEQIAYKTNPDAQYPAVRFP